VRDRSRQQSVRRSRLPRDALRHTTQFEKYSITPITPPNAGSLPRDSASLSLPAAQVNSRHVGAHRETVHRTSHCLRRRFSEAGLVPIPGCGQPVTTTGVPLQTPHTSMRDRINSTPLSADRGQCQAHFFRTIFCVARPLAQTIERCSARGPCGGIGT
jgi:hypothetical protein